MKCSSFSFLLFFFFLALDGLKAQKTVHVMVPLCDHEAQSVISDSDKLCDGQDPANNLYWGARYGVKGYFTQDPEWELLKSSDPERGARVRTALFHHSGKDLFMYAEAFDGNRMKACLKRFIGSAAGDHRASVEWRSEELSFGTDSDLLAFCGHNGLMDHPDLDMSRAFERGEPKKDQDLVVLACDSKSYFEPYIEKVPVSPLVWTSGLMSPEAYTLDGILTKWAKGGIRAEVRKAAAKTYDEYQNCGLRAAERLFLCTE